MRAVDVPAELRLRQLLVQRLESLQQAGVLDLPRVVRPPGPRERGRPQGEPPAPVAIDLPTEVAVAVPPSEVPPSPHPALPEPTAPLFPSDADMKKPQSVPLAERTAALARVCREVAACQRCGELASTRTQTVFGVGNPLARLVFLGEAPGADEDRQGEPFVGRAGQLLNKIIEACTLRREDVYILNILKCRPPGNRNPAPAEAANCRDFLERQLAIIQPEFICCLGAVAAQNLLETTVAIGQLRGRFHRFGDAQVMATYHPAYLLRNPAAKHATWDDMRMLMKAMGIAVPAR
jgi:DNA polymerase